MAKQKRTPGDKKAGRSELKKRIKHPYITGQGLQPRRAEGEDRDRESGTPPAES